MPKSTDWIQQMLATGGPFPRQTKQTASVEGPTITQPTLTPETRPVARPSALQTQVAQVEGPNIPQTYIPWQRGATGVTQQNGGYWWNPGSTWRPAPEALGQMPWYQGLTGGQLPSWRGPSQIPFASAQYWNRMSPSERLGLQGALEHMGVYWPDYQWAMQRLWPRRSMTQRPRFTPAWW